MPMLERPDITPRGQRASVGDKKASRRNEKPAAKKFAKSAGPTIGSTAHLDDEKLSWYQKPVVVVSACVATIALAIGSFALFDSMKDDPTSTDSSSRVVGIDLTDEQKAGIEDTVATFMNKAGNFGLRMDKVNGDNALNVSYIVAESRNATSEEFYKSRLTSYNSVSDLIYKGGPLDYDSRLTVAWDESYEMMNLYSYKLVSDSPAIPSQGYSSSGDGAEGDNGTNRGKLTVEVPITFTSKITSLQAVADDSSWAGDYSVMEKPFSNEKMEMVLIQDANAENGWRVYDLRNMDKPFLLSTWKNPDSTTFALDQQGMTKVDTIEPKSK